jgi:hypothetical protein
VPTDGLRIDVEASTPQGRNRVNLSSRMGLLFRLEQAPSIVLPTPRAPDRCRCSVARANKHKNESGPALSKLNCAFIWPDGHFASSVMWLSCSFE